MACRYGIGCLHASPAIRLLYTIFFYKLSPQISSDLDIIYDFLDNL